MTNYFELQVEASILSYTLYQTLIAYDRATRYQYFKHLPINIPKIETCTQLYAKILSNTFLAKQFFFFFNRGESTQTIKITIKL